MISVIGAGPVGSYSAGLLSSKGYKVNLFDEKVNIGKPVQCTGLLTKDFLKFFKKNEMSDFLINRIKSIRIVSQNNSEVIIPADEYVVDRTRFDNYMLERAINNGVKFYSKHKFVKNNSSSVLFKNNKKYSYDTLIGADGPQSRVAKVNSMYGNRKFLLGIQARVKISCDSSQYSVFFDNKKYPGFFGWIVPESDRIARVGVAGINPKKSFDYLLKKLDVSKTIEYQGGLIPVYNRKQIIEKNNVKLIGDAALQVKATTGGGIVPGFIAAQTLVRSIKKNESYSKMCNDKLKLKLYTHLKIRNLLNTFSNKDYNYLVNMMNQDKVKKVLNSTSRDSIVKLSSKMLLKEPRFLFFLKNFLKTK